MRRSIWARRFPHQGWVWTTAVLTLCSGEVLASGSTEQPATQPAGATLGLESGAPAESGWSYEPGEGMRWQSPTGDVQVKFGGRVQLDMGFQSATREVDNAFGPFTDGVAFRRARFFAEGTLYQGVSFRAEYDFAGNGSARFQDVWMSLNDLVGDIEAKIGHFKEPIGLEELTSANYITFMERSVAAAFYPVRNTGIQLSDTAGANHINWAVGVFRNTDNFGNDTDGPDGEYNATGRLTGAPLYREDGTQVVHLGAAFSFRQADEDVATFSTRTENNFAPTVAEVVVPADQYWTGGVEAAWVWSSFSLQGEYYLTSVDASVGEDPTFSGYYVMASWFLTGESRPYRPQGGTFGRVKPKSNWGQGGGGAWELAARYSALDLNDETYVGGELNDITLGANWYLNPNTRIMFNYVFSDVADVIESGTDVNGDINAFLIRFQVDF